MKTLILLSLFIGLSQSISRHKEILKDHLDTDKYMKRSFDKHFKDEIDIKIAKRKAKVIKDARKSAENINNANDISSFVHQDSNDRNLRDVFVKDPVLNKVRRRSDKIESMDTSKSSSRELQNWKTEWKEMWAKRKIEAMNMTRPAGDVVNLVAPRPWGVPCGDPAQHDMPAGTCVLPAECDGEYRIYRGDYFCGHTYFVCCSISYRDYDMYHALDVSLQDSELLTDSADRSINRDPKKASKKKQRRERIRRQRLRRQRKRKMWKTIVKIAKEVRKILNKAYKNGSKIRSKKTKTMRKFIKYLKKQFRKDRVTAKEIHEQQIWDVDYELMQKLNEIREVNKQFLANETFRNIITSKKMTTGGARMLANSYPELKSFIYGSILRKQQERSKRRSKNVNRPREGPVRPREKAKAQGWEMGGKNFARRSGFPSQPRHRKRVNYDVEYGLLYS